MATSPQPPHPRRSAPDPIKALWRSWLARKGPVFSVAAKFAALMALYYVFSLLPISDRALNGLVTGTARLANCLLNLLGEKSQLTEATLSSGLFAITVLKACTCVEFVWFYCAALIVFPSPWTRKLPGILIGAAALLALNLLRVMSLFLVGVHFPKAFDMVHEDIWSVSLIIATLFLTLAWIGWARRGEEPTHDVA